MAEEQKGKIQERYEKLATDRSPYLEDAYRASELTIQYVLPRNGQNKAQSHPAFKKQHQSMGPLGVNNLANKILLTVFPPNQPFFKLGVDDFTAAELADDDQARSKVEQGFAAIENRTTDHIERSGIRPPFEEVLKHLLICGNVLVNRLPKGGIEVFHMDQYVVARDPDGKPREIVLEELHTFNSLPERVQLLLKSTQRAGENPEDSTELISLYTRIMKRGDFWFLEQETKGVEIPVIGPNKFSDKNNPWFALRFHSIKGSAWGPGYIHNFLGDLDTLEQLWKSFTHAVKAMAFLLFLLRPGSTVKPKDIINKINGGFISANEGDVSVLQTNKGADLQVVMDAADRIARRLARAFLMDEAITRDAERVTAEEIRMLAQRLEENLGGFYSVFTQEFQVKFLQLTLDDLIKRKILPPLDKDKIKPVIITGLDALGRNSEAEKIRMFVQELSVALGPDVVASIVNPLDLARRLGVARGVDIKGLIKTQDQLDKEKQQAQQQAAAERVTGPAINAGAKVATSDVGQEALAGMAGQQ